MAPYIGIIQKPPTTMTDLETATAPSKSIVTALSCSTVTLSSGQQSHAKIQHQMSWNPTNQPYLHPSTQLYMSLLDDPLPATTMNHAITTKHTAADHALHPLSSTNIGEIHKIGANNVTGTNAGTIYTQAPFAIATEHDARDTHRCNTPPQLPWAHPMTLTLPANPTITGLLSSLREQN